MNLFSISSSCALAAATLLALPASSQARDHKVTYYQDRDHDGHYNKKTIEVRGGDRHYYGARYYGGRYYAPGYYGARSYGYPYGFYYGPTISVYSTPSYSSYYHRSDDTASAVQSALRRRGYYRGAVDGDIGPGSRAAIRDYQIDRRLPVTGRIDGPLLDSLGL